MAIAGRCAMIEAMKPAEPSDWKVKPLPKKRAVIPLDRLFSQAEMLKIRQGLRPEQMEDKWFIGSAKEKNETHPVCPITGFPMCICPIFRVSG